MQDFNLQVTQNLERQCAHVREENFALRNCLKQVQREMIELMSKQE